MTGIRYQVHTNQHNQSWTTTEKYAKNAAEQMGSALRRISDTDWQGLQKLGAAAQNTLNERGMTRGQVARILGSGRTTTTTTGGRTGGRSGGGGRVGTPAPDVVIDPLAGIKFQQTGFDGGVMSSEFNSMVTELAAKYFKQTFDESIRNMDSETVKSLMQTTETVNDVFKNVDINKPEPKKQDNGDTKEKTKETDEIGKAAKAFGAINNIMGALQNMGVKVPEGLQKAMNVMQSLISAIQSVQTIVQMFATSSQAANTAAVTANTGALIAMQGALAANTTINAIPFLAGGGVAGKVVNSKRFAYGGMVSGISKRAANGFVGGNNYSGDLIPIAVNSGELILNRAQQGNIASQLTHGSGIANLSLEKVITGEDIRIVLNNNKRRRSRGEYL